MLTALSTSVTPAALQGCSERTGCSALPAGDGSVTAQTPQASEVPVSSDQTEINPVSGLTVGCRARGHTGLDVTERLSTKADALHCLLTEKSQQMTCFKEGLWKRPHFQHSFREPCDLTW